MYVHILPHVIPGMAISRTMAHIIRFVHYWHVPVRHMRIPGGVRHVQRDIMQIRCLEKHRQVNVNLFALWEHTWRRQTQQHVPMPGRVIGQQVAR